MRIDADIAYDRKSQIGVGAGLNSDVYMAHDPQLGGDVVAKEIPKRNLDVSAYFDEAQAMFAAAHRNVVQLHYACQTPDKVCLVMPYFSEGSLQDRLVHGGLPISEVIRVADGILSGLGHIHAQGYVHCDVKPTNIFFDDTNNPLVADFGQARQMIAGGVAAAPRIYICAFPPETLSSHAVSAESDIYQAGLTLYRALHGDGFYQSEALSAENKFGDIRIAIAQGKFPVRDKFLPHVPRRLRTIVRKALSLAPSARYRTAHDMATDLAKCSFELNWEVSGAGPEFTWRAERDGKRDVVVELRETNSGWSIEAYKENGTRRRTELKHWVSAPTAPTALKESRELFKALSGRG